MYKINNLVIFLLVVIFANEIRADVVENSFDFNFGGIMMQGEEEEETKRIVLETQFPQDVPMSYPATMLAFYVDKLSGGKMEVVINPNGEPLSKFPYALPKADQFKRVVKGIDSHILLGEPSSWPTGNAKYFFQGIPFGLSGDEQDIWMQQHGGQELMDDHYRKHGIRAFPAGNTGAYAGGFFKEALDEEQDSLNQARGTSLRNLQLLKTCILSSMQKS